VDNRQSTTAYSDADDMLISDESKIADHEARNGLLQFDEVRRLVSEFAPDKRMPFTEELVRGLNRIAIQGVRRSAGYFRLVPIEITNTVHQPPPFEEVPKHVEDMCAYVNTNWDHGRDDVESAIHLAAYLMWRLNWIHPFRDGNGRTSRAVSYLVLSVRLGRELVGIPTIADQIVDNKNPYYHALDEADAAWRNGILDVSAMENLIYDLLIIQLQ
jgi:Fic family protein